MATSQTTNGVPKHKSGKRNKTTVDPNLQAVINGVQAVVSSIPAIIQTLTACQIEIAKTDLTILEQKVTFLENSAGGEIPGNLKFTLLASEIFPGVRMELPEPVSEVPEDILRVQRAQQLIDTVSNCYDDRKLEVAFAILKHCGITLPETAEFDPADCEE
jgi:hypothetical protein